MIGYINHFIYINIHQYTHWVLNVYIISSFRQLFPKKPVFKCKVSKNLSILLASFNIIEFTNYWFTYMYIPVHVPPDLPGGHMKIHT